MIRVLLVLIFTSFAINLHCQSILNKVGFGGEGNNQVFKSTLDSNNNLYTIGYFSGKVNVNGVEFNSKGLELDIYVSKYDSNGNLLWFIPIGSDKTDYSSGLTLSLDQNSLYITGYYLGNVCDFGNGFLLSNSSTGTADAFIAELETSDGSVKRALKIAYGEGGQFITDLQVDNQSNLVLTGYVVGDGLKSIFNSTDFTCIGILNNFILKTSFDFNVIWLKHYTSDDPNNNFYSLSVDQTGYYIAGMNKGNLNLDVRTLTSQGPFQDMFLYKTDYNGGGQWIRSIKGNNKDVSQFATCDQQGHVYISGYYASTDLKVDSTATLQSTRSIPNRGSNDIFFAKYDTNGTLQWFDVAGSKGDDRVTRLSTDGENIVIAGQFGGKMRFNNEELIPEIKAPGDTTIDAIGIVHDKNDNLLYAIKMGGSGSDVAQSCVIDSEGNYIFTGNFYSPTLKFDSDPTHNLTNSTPTTRDVFIAKYKSRSISFVSSNVLCNGSATGSITANPKGAWSGNLSYSWTKDGDLTFTASSMALNNITAGTYNCTVSSGLYSESASITITEPAPLVASENITSHKNAKCFGSVDGALALTVTGGTGAKGYVWTGDGTGIIASNASQNALSAGTYNVTVTDANGCKAVVNNMVVTQPPKINFKGTQVTHINGSQGKVDLSVNNALVPFTAAWSGAGSYSTFEWGIEDIAVAGNYSVEITDQAGCKADTTVLIVDSHNLYGFVSDKKNVSCKGGNNGSITVTPQTDKANPSFSFAWTGPDAFYPSASTISGSAGTYSVIITNSNATPVESFTISNIVITEPMALTATASAGNITCFGQANGYVDANGSGGTLPYTYRWKKNSSDLTDVTEVITSLGDGNYEVTITDAGNCTVTASATIATPPPIYVNSAVVTPVTCIDTKNDGSIALNVSGGTGTLSYLWSNGLTSSNISLLSAGTYSCVIKDQNNCTVSTQQTVAQPSPISATFSNTNVTCYGGSNGAINLTPSGGNNGSYTFLWSNNQTNEDLSGIGSGTYTVTVTDSKKCEKTFTTSLTQPIEISILSSVIQNANCNGAANGEIRVSAVGGSAPYLWEWSNGQTNSTASGLIAGNYSVTVTDSKNCTKNANYTITEPSALQISEVIASHIDVTCNGATSGRLEVSSSGSTGTYEYSLDGNTWQSSPLFNNIVSGNYNVMVRDQSVTSCTKAISPAVVISQPSALSFGNPVINAITCKGFDNGSIEVQATGGTGQLVYKLKLGGTESANTSGASNGKFNGLSGGTDYTVEVTDANNCKLETSNITVIEPQAIALATPTVTNITCLGLTNGTIKAQANGGTGALSYKLFLNDVETGNTSGAISGNFTGLAGGVSYKISVTDANNCTPVITSPLSITSPEAISVTSLVANNITCPGLGNGNIKALATGGNGNYSYKLLLNNTPHNNVTGATSGEFTGLSAGSGYRVEITDGNNCGPVVSDPVNIQEPAQITIISQTARQTTGSGNSDGAINIIATGGSGTLSYKINTGIIQNSGIFDGLAIGTYQVSITDANNCNSISSNQLIIDSPTSIEPVNGNVVKLYPNPVSERVFVEVHNKEYKILKVELKSISGQAAISRKFENVSDGFVAEIDINQLPKGIYVIVVNNSIIKDKLIVQ